jgi:hypothetical protein
MTSQTVSIKNIELFSQFAKAFNKLREDAELPMKTKLSIGKLSKELTKQALLVEQAKQLLQSKGDTLTEEDSKMFNDFLMESTSYQFDKLDVTMIAKNLNVLELEALEPIIK